MNSSKQKPVIPPLTPTQKAILLSICLFGCFSTIITLIGWIFYIPSLLIHSSSTDPMSFNGALMILTGSVAGVLLILGYGQFVRPLLYCVLIAVAIYFIHTLLQLNWGFEKYLYHSTTDPALAHPLTPSTIGIVSGAFLTMSFFLIASKNLTIATLFMTTFMVMSSLAISLSSIFGYFTGTISSYEWFTFTNMSILTSGTLAILSIAILNMTSRYVKVMYPDHYVLWSPIMGTIGAITLLVAFIISIIAHQQLAEQGRETIWIIHTYVVIIFISSILIAFVFWMLYLLQRIKRVNAQLEDAMHMKTMFLANMTHEIRSPLHAVLGTIYMLDNTPLTNKQQSLISNLYLVTHQLLLIVNNVLDLTQLESGSFQLEETQCDIKKIIEDQVQIYTPVAEKQNVQLELKFANEYIPELWLDSRAIPLILSNLINNAIKFTEHGKISVTTGITAIDSNAGLLNIKVQDTGVGIANENIANLFQKFTQFDQAVRKIMPRGSGLGLYIVQLLVNAMHGSIIVKSERGIGSTFEIIIPAKFVSYERKTKV